MARPMKPLKQWRASAEYFQAGGHRIAFWASRKPDDSKPWLLLIHGYPTSSWDWSGVWPSLKPHFNLAAIDMLGFGLSDKPRDIQYKIMHQADLQEAFLSELGVGEAHLFAHDYGDTVAQELLARHLEGTLSFAMKSICFLNGGLFPEQHRARPIQKFGLTPFGSLMALFMNKARLRKSLDEVFGPNTKASDEEIDAFWTLMKEQNGHRVLHKLLRYIPDRIEYRERWVGALKDASFPMRLIIGGADPVSGEHLYHYYREQVPQADALLFDLLGHYPQTEAPNAIVKAFLDFHHKTGVVSLPR